MHLYFGTVVRGAPVRQGGDLIKLNWDTKSIEARVPIYPDNPSLDHDQNPRGNTRGCRGIVLQNGHVIAANFHTLQVFDHELRPRKNVTHGLMTGLHEVHEEPDGSIWVTSTAIGAALR